MAKVVDWKKSNQRPARARYTVTARQTPIANDPNGHIDRPLVAACSLSPIPAFDPTEASFAPVESERSLERLAG
ncbi:hypothetical protein SB772_38730 [Paraburkholderia sp. SIMBA_030]